MKRAVSILTPAYNAEKFINASIESILNQTFTDFEFIIIDDCSTDRTWEIIQDYAKRDNRISVYKNEKNVYIAENRNRLIQKANCDIIAWQDADDISYPQRIEKQYNFIKNHPEVGIVGSYIEFFNDNGTTSIRKYAEEDESLRKKIFQYSPVAQPSAMIRKKCFTELGLYNPEFPPAEDLDMSFRIGSKYKFANLPEVLLKYRENPNSATFKRLRKIEISTLKIRKLYYKGYGYKVSLFDYVYNILHFVSIFLIPSKLKIGLFNLIRNS